MLWKVSRPCMVLCLAFLAIHVEAQETEPRPPPAADAVPAETAEADAEPAAPGGLLDPVVVTATRFDESAFDVPYTVTPIDGRTAATEKGARTLPEALREVPGVMVQKT